MKTIKFDSIYEYVIKKSKFIVHALYVENEEDAKDKLDKIRNEYKDATHVCYGYIVDNIIRFSDDGEPCGTAGMPIINVLKNKELNHVLLTVVRYFGGIKLGAGGLVRAYSNAVVLALDENKIVELKNGYEISLKFDINNIKFIDNILKKYNVFINKTFTDNVLYDFMIACEDFENLKLEVNNLGEISIKKNALIR